MKDYITIAQLARRLGVHRSNIWRRVKRLGIAIKSPVMTRAGPQIALWVPESYAAELEKYYRESRQ